MPGTTDHRRLPSRPPGRGAHPYDGDGTEGCRQIKKNGGTTFAQDASAEAEEMPLSAQAAGCIDFVLPPEKIPRELKKLVLALTRPSRLTAKK